MRPRVCGIATFRSLLQAAGVRCPLPGDSSTVCLRMVPPLGSVCGLLRFENRLRSDDGLERGQPWNSNVGAVNTL